MDKGPLILGLGIGGLVIGYLLNNPRIKADLKDVAIQTELELDPLAYKPIMTQADLAWLSSGSRLNTVFPYYAENDQQTATGGHRWRAKAFAGSGIGQPIALPSGASLETIHSKLPY